MNFYFLVEGRSTEKRVYRAWVPHFFSDISYVGDIHRVTDNCFTVFSGNGYPDYLKKIGKSLDDIRQHGSIDAFFVCADVEEWSWEDRRDEVPKRLEFELQTRSSDTAVQNLRSYVIVQNCCIETWFLRHSKMLRRNPESPDLRACMEHFDVRTEDPEDLPAQVGFDTKAQYHLHYLKTMLAERGLRYSKTHPGTTTSPEYFTALRDRSETGHLRSLQHLVDCWQEELDRSDVAGTSE